MQAKKEKYYSDILLAIQLIEDFTKDTSSFELFSADKKTKSAAERQLSIIGEAVNNIRKMDNNDLQDIDQIVAFRNRIIHAYDNIDDSIIWAIIKNHLPILKKHILSK